MPKSQPIKRRLLNRFEAIYESVQAPEAAQQTPFGTQERTMKLGIKDESTKTRILVVDDHPLVRNGLVKLLSQQSDLVCCGEAGTVAETQSAAARLHPNLILLDLRLRSGDGLELIKSLTAQFPDSLILVLSQYDDRLFVERALRAGARGYLLKDQAAHEVLNAIRSVLAGEIYLSPALLSCMLRKLRDVPNEEPDARLELLTDRELHVLQLLGRGLSTRQIAIELNLNFKTIETHRENLKHKLELRNAPELVHYAINLFGSERASA